MARTALTVQEIVTAGITPSLGAANVDGHSIPGTGDVVVHVKNGSASPVSVTIPTPGVAGKSAEPIADRVVSVPATTGDKIIGPFDPAVFQQPDGTVYIDLSAVATVTITAYRVKL